MSETTTVYVLYIYMRVNYLEVKGRICVRQSGVVYSSAETSIRCSGCNY